MQGDEPARHDSESTWKHQEEEQVQMTLDEVCVKARAFEKKSIARILAGFGGVGAIHRQSGYQFCFVLRTDSKDGMGVRRRHLLVHRPAVGQERTTWQSSSDVEAGFMRRLSAV